MSIPILHQIELPDDGGTIILYDWMVTEMRDGRNLVRLDRNGRELWRAEPIFYGEAAVEDSFTRVAWDGEKLTASTFSCFDVAVDVASGKVTTLKFTK